MKRIRTLMLLLVVAISTLAEGSLSITAVSAQQRYPWNGLVDITVTFEGSADDVAEVTCSFTATNCATGMAIPVSSIAKNGADTGSGTTWLRRFIWNATSDVGEVKIDDFALTVVANAFGGVQLWKDGPYWAKRNVGAKKPEEYGYYFWWGDTVGYKRNVANDGWVSVGAETMFTFQSDNCPTWGKDDSWLKSVGRIDAIGNLVRAHDAAAVHLGAPWRMPTDSEFAALINNCDTEWTVRNGVYGLLVIGRGMYASQSIFLPAGGLGTGSLLEGDGSEGFYLSSTPYLAYPGNAWFLWFNSSAFERDSIDRFYGQPIRPLRGCAEGGSIGMAVYGKTKNLKIDCRMGKRVCSADGESLQFDASWYDNCDEVRISDNGVVLANGVTGVYTWMPESCSSTQHVFRLEILSGGQVIGVESAEFSCVAPTKEHTTVVTNPAIEPTRTAPGMTAEIRCSRCGEIVQAATEIPAINSFCAVTAQSRYPWDGLVDIAVTFDGSAVDVAEIEWSFAATNCATGAAVPVMSVTQNGSDTCSGTTWTRRYVWNAFNDVGSVEIDDLAITVKSELGVQLWEKGPSWAKCNVGAAKPEECGYYFWWGDTMGCVRNSDNNGFVSVKDGVAFSFDSGNCPTHNKSSSQLRSAGFVDETGNLATAHDSATAYLGEPWRMPTDSEYVSLVTNCTTTFVVINGVAGRLISGKGSFASRSIFLPAAGFCRDSDIEYKGSYGLYWSSSPYLYYNSFASDLYFLDDYFSQNANNRYCGQTVRPVRGSSDKRGVPSMVATAHLKLGHRSDVRKCSIRTVTAHQRYPWNGIVDIVVTLEGSSDDVAKTACYFAASNCVTGAAVPVASITQNGCDTGSGNNWTRRFVWDATNDVGKVKIGDIAITVDARALGGVQLWENGPYWAECNVGASEPEDFGYYFWWGDIEGYKRNGGTWRGDYSLYTDVTWEASTGRRIFSSPFVVSSCPTYDKGYPQLLSDGYIDAKCNLMAPHDAATAHLGASWRMPTKEEMYALISNCTTTWTTRNGVKGRLVKGKGAYSSRSIFLPAAGYGSGSDIIDVGLCGHYWSSTSDGGGGCAYLLYYNWLSEFSCFYNYCFSGRSVRPIRGYSDAKNEILREGITTHLKFDCSLGAYECHPGGGMLRYDASWYENADEVRIIDDGIVLAKGTAGVYTWTPGAWCSTRHMIRLEILSAGQIIGEETAEFICEKPTLEHMPVITQPAVEPAAGSPGMTEEICCSRCGELLQAAAKIPALLFIRNVNARQRYPWNGLVDVVVTMEGLSNDVMNAAFYFAASNCVTGTSVPVTSITRYGSAAGSGVNWTRRFVWNATNDAGGVKIDDLAFTVEAKVMDGVQLWKDGPYWAEFNVGASKPEESGYYFWWGDTVGYKRNAANDGWISVKDGSGFSFSIGNCPTYGQNDSQLQSAGYIDATGNLTAEHDAATAHLGASWRMPTESDFSALIGNCTTTWISTNGVYGRLVMGKGAFAAKSIFLPATGYAGTSFNNDRSDGFCWSSTPYDGESPSYACRLYFNSGHFHLNGSYYYRYLGHTVRPVRELAQTSVLAKSGVTTHLKLDCRIGVRECATVGENLCFDASWFDNCDEVRILVNGVVVTNGISGVYSWTPDPCSATQRHVFRLEVLSNGNVVGSESAEFVYTAPVDPIPDIGDSPSAADVAAVVAVAADEKVAANIDETNYNDFRDWAGNVKAVDGNAAAGAAGVIASETAWISYALGQGVLLGAAPTDEDLSVETFTPSTKSGKFDFTVSVKDIEVSSEATKENLKKVFGLEGAATLDNAAFSSDKIDIEFATPVNGNVKFTAGPKDADAKAFFMKVKLNP